MGNRIFSKGEIKMDNFGIIGGESGLGFDRAALRPDLSFPQVFFGDPMLLRENRVDGRGLAIVSISKSCLGPHAEKFLKVMAAAPKLFHACEKALAILESQMDEAEKLDHAFDGHDAEDCPICILREAMVAVEL
jgi:hypothetical protein